MEMLVGWRVLKPTRVSGLKWQRVGPKTYLPTCTALFYCLWIGSRFTLRQQPTINHSTKGEVRSKSIFFVPFYRCNFIWKAEAISCEHCRFVVCLHAPKSHVQRSRAYSLALYALISVYTFSILFLCISLGTVQENLFHNQELFKLLIISFILKTFVCDSGVIL